MSGIIDLIKTVGEENVQVQPLEGSMTNIAVNRKGLSKVTFETRGITPDDVMRGGGQTVGLVLWLPRDKVAAWQAGGRPTAALEPGGSRAEAKKIWDELGEIESRNPGLTNLPPTLQPAPSTKRKATAGRPKLLEWSDAGFSFSEAMNEDYMVWSESYDGRHGGRGHDLLIGVAGAWRRVPNSDRRSAAAVRKFRGAI